MKIFIFLLFCFIYTSYNSVIEAQTTGRINGQVLDSAERSLDGAVVSLVKNATLVKTNITEADGKFEFSGLDSGKYVIMVSNFDYRTFTSEPLILEPGKMELQLPIIKLQSKTIEKLEEVAVVAKIPLVERKIDRTIVNVDAMISNAGNNALEVLEKSPGIIIDQNGNILLKGKSGVVIYIDDKPTYLSGDALQNYLKSLPASALSQIEIMTNPPAKYDAAGNVGIINIITKKSKLKGMNGSVNIDLGQGRYARNSNNINLNYRNNKFNFFGSVSEGTGGGFNNLYINRTYKNEDLSVKSFFNQNTRSRYKYLYSTLKLGADYYLNEKSTFGISMNGSLNNSQDITRNISLLYDPNETLTSTVIADNSIKSKFRNASTNLNLRHKFDSTGRSLTMDLDYVRYTTLDNQSYLNNTYNPGGNLEMRDQLDGHLPAKINIYAFKTDYLHPLKKDAKIEAGLKASYTSIDNLVNYYNVVSGIQTVDYDKSNHFKYNEVINAAYLTFSKEYKRIGFKAGLRSEGTISTGNQLGNPVKPTSRFNRDYLNIFPTGYFSYKLDSAANHQLVVSYGRRINRPYYQDLNPFVRPLDKFTFYSGNPLLLPMFSQNMSLSYSYKSYFSTEFTYIRTKNEINETIEIDTNQLYFSRPGNIGQSEVLSFSVNATIPFAKWLSTTIYSEVTNTHYTSKLYTENLNSRGTFYYLYINNSFKFNKNWSAELSGYYISKMVSAQFTLAPRGQVTVAVRKKILKDKGNIKLSIQDLFYTQINSGAINNLRLTDANYNNRGDSRVVYLSFSYAFGKPFASEPKHQESGSESEQKRVKN